MANEFRHTGFSSKADREGEKKMALDMKKVGHIDMREVAHTVNDRSVSRFVMLDRNADEAVGALEPILVCAGKVIAYRCAYWGKLTEGEHDHTVVERRNGENRADFILRSMRAAYELIP